MTPRTITAERETRIFGYTYLTKHNMWEVKAELDAERAVSKALAEALPPSVRLRWLADWLDQWDEDHAQKGHDEVQRDLRRWARQIDEALAQYAASQPEKEINLEPR